MHVDKTFTEVTQPWTFLVEAKAIALDIRTENKNGETRHHYSIRCDGVVISEHDPSVKSTSVYITMFAGDDEEIGAIQRKKQAIGQTVVSRHAASIRGFQDPFSDPEGPIAGIVTKIALTVDQFRELRDTLALSRKNVSVCMEFRCIGDGLVQRSVFSTPTLNLDGHDRRLNVVSYKLSVNVLTHNEADKHGK